MPPRAAGPITCKRLPLASKAVTVTAPGSPRGGVAAHAGGDPQVPLVVIVLDDVALRLGGLDQVLVGIVEELVTRLAGVEPVASMSSSILLSRRSNV